MFQTIKNKIDNYITEKAKSILAQNKPEKLDFVDSEDRITPEEAKKLLSISFQRTAEKSFRIATPDGKTVAMDAACGCKLPQPYGLEGVGRDIIFTFFAKHAFIGWQICALLDQHWLVHRACTIPNQDAMAPGWQNVYLKDEQEQDEQILTDLYQKSEQKYHLAKKCVDFGNNRKIFGIGIAFPIIEGVDPSLPFNIDAVKPGSYKGISVIDPYWCLPSWTESSMSEPGNLHFYEPEYYSFYFNGKLQKVHRSNLIISTNGKVPDILKPTYYFGGIPLPQMMYERVYAAEKVANEAPLLALTKRLLVADANLEQLYTDPENSKKKIDRLVKMRDNFGVWCKQPGDQFTQIDTSLADFDALIMTQYQIVAGIVDVPMFKLMGSNFKGLNPTGEGELKNYVQTLQSLQENVFKPLIERHNLLCMKSDFNINKMVSAKFNPVDMPTEKELAEVEALKAQTDTAYVNSGILTPEEVRAKVAADTSNSYNSLSEELPEDLDLEEGAFHESEMPKAILTQDEWKETDHPRDDDGKFAEKGSAKISQKSDSKKPAPRDLNSRRIGVERYAGKGDFGSLNAQAAYRDGLVDETLIDSKLAKIAPNLNEKQEQALKDYFYSEWHHVGQIEESDDPIEAAENERAARMKFYDVDRFKYGDHLAEVVKMKYSEDPDLVDFSKKYKEDDVVDIPQLAKLLVANSEKREEAKRQFENLREATRERISNRLKKEYVKNGLSSGERPSNYSDAVKSGKVKDEEKNADISLKLKGQNLFLKNAYFYKDEWGDFIIYDKKGGKLVAKRKPSSIKIENERYTDDYKKVTEADKKEDEKRNRIKIELIAKSLSPEVKQFISSANSGLSISQSGNIYKYGEKPRSADVPEGLTRLYTHYFGSYPVDLVLEEYKNGKWEAQTKPKNNDVEFGKSYLNDVWHFLNEEK